MKIKSLLFSILLPLAVIGNETALELRCIPSPNLVRNADFSMLNAKGLPQGWYFDNCSKSPEFKTQIIKHADGNYMAIDSAWIKFGYWLLFRWPICKARAVPPTRLKSFSSSSL